MPSRIGDSRGDKSDGAESPIPRAFASYEASDGAAEPRGIKPNLAINIKRDTFKLIHQDLKI